MNRPGKGVGKGVWAPIGRKTFSLGRRFQIVLMALCVTASAWGAYYNERASGDLSDDQNSPTVIGMDPGANVISGQVSDSPLDRDFFTLQVPGGVPR